MIKRYSITLISFILIAHFTNVLAIETAYDAFKFEPIVGREETYVDRTVFEDPQKYSAYTGKVDEIRITYELQEDRWEKEATELRDEGKDGDAEELEKRIEETTGDFGKVSIKLEALGDAWELLSDVDKAQNIRDLNDIIDKYNKSVDTLGAEIVRVEKELVTHEVTPSPDVTPKDAIPQEWKNFEQRAIPELLQEMTTAMGERWQDAQETWPTAIPEQILADLVQVLNVTSEAARKILAKLEDTVPLKTRADYETHLDILRNLQRNTLQAQGLQLDEIQERIDEIDNFLDTTLPSPQTPLESQLDLQHKATSDRMEALTPSFIDAFKNKVLTLFDEMMQAMGHYHLTDVYQDTVNFIKNGKDVLRKALEPAPQPTPEEIVEESYFQTMFEGVDKIKTTMRTTAEGTFEGIKEMFDVATDAAKEYVKFAATDAATGAAGTAASAAGFAAETLNNAAEFSSRVATAAEQVQTIAKILSYIPDFVMEPLEAQAGAQLGALVEKTVEKKLTQLSDAIRYTTGQILGDNAAWTVDNIINTVHDELVKRGADKILIKTTESLVTFTIDQLRNHPDVIATPTEFFNSASDLAKSLATKFQKTQRLADRFATDVQSSLHTDLKTARELIDNEANRLQQQASRTRWGALKDKVSSWLQSIRDAFRSIFSKAEPSLGRAKDNYTKARDDYLKFIGIDDPAQATDELIGRQIQATNDLIKTSKPELGTELKAKTDAFAQVQSDLANVFLEHEKALNGTMASFELIVKAWKGVAWPKIGDIGTPEWVKQHSYARDIIRVFDLRDQIMAHYGVIHEGLEAIKEEAATLKGSDFEPMNQKFIDNVSTMVNNELINTITLFDDMVSNMKINMTLLQEQLEKNLGIGE